LIVEGENVANISKRYNLSNPEEKIFSRSDFKQKDNYGEDFPNELVNIIFKIDESQATILEERDNEYFIIELIKTNKVISASNDPIVKEDILMILEKQNKIKILSDIATRVNNKKFLKKDFYEFSKKENSEINNLTFGSLNDDKKLNKDFVAQIYKLPESSMMVITNQNLTENYLVYIKSIKNSYIKKDDENYDKYLNLAEVKLTSSIYNTYDLYLKNKYKIDINYKVLKSIKNYTE
jgi:hypothetical protein